MPQLIPVDFDPFAAADADAAAPAPASSAPSSSSPGLISFASPPPAANDAAQAAAGPRLIPVDHDPFAASSSDTAPSDDTRPLTIRRGSVPTPAPPTDLASSPAAPATPSPTLPPGGISYEDAVAALTPNPGGALSNSPDDGTLSSLAKGAGTAVLKGLSDVPGVFGNAMDMADYLAARAQAKITGRPADDVLKEWADAKAASAADPSWTRYLDPRNFLPSGEQVAAPVLAKTGEYVPTSEAGKLAMAAGEAATGGALTPGMGGLKALAPNALAGAAGQGAADLTGDPLYGMGAGLIAAPAAEAAAAGTAKLAGPMVQGLRALDNVPVVGAAIQNAVDRKAAGMVLDASSDPIALRQWAAAPEAPPIVPNSPNTLAASVGTDQGLFEAEKAARNVKVPTGEDEQPAPTYFNQVDAAKSRAQVAALQGAAPAGADVMRPGQVLGARMDAIDAAASQAEDMLNAAHQDAVSGRAAASQAFADQQNADLAGRVADRGQDAADTQSQAMAQRQAAHDALVQSFQDAQDRGLATAQSAAAPLGGRVSADDLGATLRGAVEEVRAGAKGLHRDLYAKVDPDNSLAMVASPIRDRASSIAGQVAADGSELAPVEAGLFRRAAALPDVASYRVIHALDRDVGAAMAAERRSAGESPAWARLTQLKGAVKSAMMDATDNQVAHETRMVSAGLMAPEDTILARLGEKADEWDAAARQPQARAATGTGDPAYPGAGTIGFSGAPGTDISSRGRAGYASGDPGLSPSPRGAGQGASRTVGPSRFTAPFHDDTALTRSPQRPDMPRPESLSSFVWRNGGVQDPGGDLAAMGQQRLIAKPGQGLSPDRMREAAAEAGYLGGDTARAVRETTPVDLLNALENGDRTFSVADDDALHAWDQYDQTKAAYDRGRSDSEGRSTFGAKPAAVPLSAYSVDDVYGPDGMPLPGMSAPRLAPTFDKAANERLKEANAAYARYAQTFKQGPVAAGLRTSGYAGAYQRSNASFIKAAVKPGTEGYENAKAYLRAAANDPAAIGAMHEAALNPLRKAVTGNGTLSPRALASWKDSYGPALRALDEVTPGFSSRFDTAADATQALVDLGAQHKAALEAYQSQAAAEAMAGRKAGTADLKAANTADVAATRAAIADRSAGDRAANAQSKADTAATVAQAKGIASAAQASPAGAFAKATSGAVSPTEVENTVGGFIKTGTGGVARMRGLVQSVANDPDALAGLRKAGTDWMVRSFVNDGTGELSAAKFIRFLKQDRDVLKELYPVDHLAMMGAVARDAEAGMRWRTSTAVKGGSDTEKNRLATMAGKAGEAAKHPVSLGVASVEAISQGYEHGGLKGAAIGVSLAAAAYLANTLRSAGIKRTSDLYRELLADPEKARAFLQKMPAAAESGALHNVARVMKRSLMVWPIVGPGKPA